MEELTEKSFGDVDIALFSAGGSISKKFAPIAADKGVYVVDNSSAFRMTDGVPLVSGSGGMQGDEVGIGLRGATEPPRQQEAKAPHPPAASSTPRECAVCVPRSQVIPEVNPEALKGMKWRDRKGALIANPNCSTIIALMAVTPLHRSAPAVLRVVGPAAQPLRCTRGYVPCTTRSPPPPRRVRPVKRMVVSTYQAASGAGQAAMDELEQQTRDVLEGKPPTQKIFPFQYAFNLFSHNSAMGPNGERCRGGAARVISCK